MEDRRVGGEVGDAPSEHVQESRSRRVVLRRTMVGGGLAAAGIATVASARTPAGAAAVIPATEVSVAPTGNLAATDAQSALAELDAEKAPLLDTNLTGTTKVDLIMPRYYPHADILAHGAKSGPGFASVTRQAIQDAINAAAWFGTRRVYIPPGEWHIDDSLLLPTGTVLFGAIGVGFGTGVQSGTSEIRLVDSPGKPAIRNADQVNGNRAITLESLRVFAPQTSGSAVSFRSTGAPCGHILIRNCQVWRGGSIGIDWFGVAGSVIEGTTVGGNGTVVTGIKLDQSPDNWILGNIVGSSRIGNSSNPGPALHIAGSSGATTVANNVGFEWSHQGIRCDSDRVTITGNLIRQNDREGIVINGRTGCTVTGNTFYNNGRAGTSVSATERCSVRLAGAGCQGNSITGNAHSKYAPDGAPFQQWGVVVDAGAHHNAVVGNTCIGMEAGGVFVHASAPNNEVIANPTG